LNIDDALGHARVLANPFETRRSPARGGTSTAVHIAPVASRLVGVATQMLPAWERARYAEEFRSELWDLAQTGGSRRAQLAYATRQLLAVPKLRAGLRSLRRRGAVP
jgi:hypothetical protein